MSRKSLTVHLEGLPEEWRVRKVSVTDVNRIVDVERDPAEILSKQGYLIDMDGVIYWENHLVPGALEFVDFLRNNNKSFLFLTNSSDKNPRELQQKLLRLGIQVEESHFYTAALSTAAFLSKQCPKGSAFVIGGNGLVSALYDVGYTMNDVDPDYVVVGESHTYNYELLTKAVNLVRGGARLIGTNCDTYDKSLEGVMPGCACLMAPIEMATGVKAYYLGKPNPLMFKQGLARLGCQPSNTVILGDRMDTDIVGGIEAGLDTVLMLSGVTAKAEVPRYPYKPDFILNGVADVLALASACGKHDTGPMEQ